MENDYSGDSFIAFTDYLANKGLLKKPTASARKAAIVAFLEILEEGEKVDVRTIDIDMLAARFANIRGDNFTPQSLATYKSRYKSAYKDFINYKENPMTFKPAVSTRRRLKLKKTDGDNGAPRSMPGGTPAKRPTTPTTIAPYLPEETIVFPIPIRKGVVVKIAGLPIDLTADEAKKIADVVQALASA